MKTNTVYTSAIYSDTLNFKKIDNSKGYTTYFYTSKETSKKGYFEEKTDKQLYFYNLYNRIQKWNFGNIETVDIEVISKSFIVECSSGNTTRKNATDYAINEISEFLIKLSTIDDTRFFALIYDKKLLAFRIACVDKSKFPTTLYMRDKDFSVVNSSTVTDIFGNTDKIEVGKSKGKRLLTDIDKMRIKAEFTTCKNDTVKFLTLYNVAKTEAEAKKAEAETEKKVATK